nr:hypothetical protein [Tanacetum cinerariifolium]
MYPHASLANKLLWMKQALVGYNIKLNDIPVLYDNKGAIDLNPKYPSLTKDGTIILTLILTTPKSNNDKKNTNSFKKTTRISVRTCCFVNPPPTSLPYQHFSPPTDYQLVPPSTLIESPPTFPMAPLGFSLGNLLNTLKTTPPPLTSPPLAPSQPSKQNSLLAINLQPVELIFSTPPTSPHPFFDSLEDVPPRTNKPPPLLEVMEPPFLPLLP